MEKVLINISDKTYELSVKKFHILIQLIKIFHNLFQNHFHLLFQFLDVVPKATAAETCIVV
jgi:hypothetical protein